MKQTSSSRFVSIARELSRTRRGSSWESAAAAFGGTPRWDSPPRHRSRSRRESRASRLSRNR